MSNSISLNLFNGCRICSDIFYFTPGIGILSLLSIFVSLARGLSMLSICLKSSFCFLDFSLLCSYFPFCQFLLFITPFLFAFGLFCCHFPGFLRQELRLLRAFLISVISILCYKLPSEHGVSCILSILVCCIFIFICSPYFKKL